MAKSSKATRRATARTLCSLAFTIVVPMFLCATSLCAGLPVAWAQSSQKPAVQSVQDPLQKKASPGATEAKPAEPPGVLVQLNSALESLAARVSPAVVQILVTGYGPLREREDDRSQTAFIVRQHAVGSGVIVDSTGYIITNAHVVEGAQRIRVALPLPMGDGRYRSGSAASWRRNSSASTRKPTSLCSRSRRPICPRFPSSARSGLTLANSCSPSGARRVCRTR